MKTVNLPIGWQWAKLSAVTRVVGGTTPKSGAEEYWTNGEIVWITPTDLGGNRDKAIDASLRRITYAGFVSCGLEIVPPGSVILSTRASIGHLGIAKVPLCTNQGCKSLVPSDSVDSEFLYFALKKAVPILQKLGSGATFAEVSKTQLENLEIALPTLGEQRRIASLLNAQLAEVEAACKAAEEQRRAARVLPFAVLRGAFGKDEIKNSPMKRLGELVNNFDGKRIPVKSDERHKRHGQYPYYGASGIIDTIDDYLFDGDFLLIGEDGANLLFRSTPIAFRAGGKFWVNNHAHVVQPKPDVLLDYLLHFFAITDLSPYVTGAAQPKLTQDALNSIRFPVPTLEIQSGLVKHLNSYLHEANKVQTMLESQLGEINGLPASLLREAFAARI